MKAQVNPGSEFSWSKKSWKEIAKAYGMEERELREEAINFQNCEGFDDDGNEHNDLHEWLVSDSKKVSSAPFQKGDDWDI